MGYIAKFLLGFTFDFCVAMSIFCGGIMLAVTAGQYEMNSLSWGLLAVACSFFGLIGGVSAARRHRHHSVQVRLYGAPKCQWVGPYIFKTSACFLMFVGVFSVGLVVNFYSNGGGGDRIALFFIFLSAFIPASIGLFILERFRGVVV